MPSASQSLQDAGRGDRTRGSLTLNETQTAEDSGLNPSHRGNASAYRCSIPGSEDFSNRRRISKVHVVATWVGGPPDPVRGREEHETPYGLPYGTRCSSWLYLLRILDMVYNLRRVLAASDAISYNAVPRLRIRRSEVRFL